MGIANGKNEGGNQAFVLAVEYLPLDALTPYEHNAKKHDDEDVASTAASIREFGFSDPIGIWGANNLIVEGHGRLLAARKLGMETVPVIRLDHMNAEQRRAYALAHNQTTFNSGWDFSELEAELAALETAFDMEGFGFDIAPDAIENPDDEEPPQSFKEFGEDMETSYKCPRCGYEWK